MRATHTVNKEFTPVILTLTFETAAELNAMYALANTATCSRNDTTYNGTKVNHTLIEMDLYNAVNALCRKAL